MSDAGRTETPKDAWHCRRCGSTRWVAASLTGGLTRVRQCVPCGYYSGDRVPAVGAPGEAQ